MSSFFVYTDEIGQYYYYNVDTKDTTYTKPSEGFFLDPKTADTFVFSQPSPGESPSLRNKKRHRGRRSSMSSQEDATTEHTSPPSLRSESVGVNHYASSPFPALTAGDDEYSIELVKWFSMPSARLSEKVDGILSGLKFQRGVIQRPLLDLHGKTLSGKALTCFQLILFYTGLGSTGKRGGVTTVAKLVGIGMRNAELRDEIFLQLIQQTRENPLSDCLARTWELLAICASVLKPSAATAGDIKILLGRSVFTAPEDKIRDCAQFAFVRLGSAPPVQTLTIDLLFRILKDVDVSHVAFGVSIAEQIYNQRRTFPFLPVPYILHVLVTVINEQGGEETEGLFRTPGNPETLSRLTGAINRGGDAHTILSHEAPDDVAALLLQWFAMLPGRVIGADTTPCLLAATADILAFLEKLPAGHTVVIKFLCAFLDHLTHKAGPNTLRDLVAVFAPLIVDIGEADATPIVAVAEDLLLAVIEDGMFAGLFPLPPRALAAGPT
jgi:hypothetical protein